VVVVVMTASAVLDACGRDSGAMEGSVRRRTGSDDPLKRQRNRRNRFRIKRICSGWLRGSGGHA